MSRIYPKATKEKARFLRKRGWSMGEIRQKMNIPKNTLSGWVRDIRLTKAQQERIKEKIAASGAIGRPIAANLMRERMENWKNSVREKVKYFGKLSQRDQETGKLIRGILYLCEGAKYPSTKRLELINSDPQIIYFFVTSLRKIFHISEDKLRISLIYRWDQNMPELINFWSNLTKIPKTQFLNSKPDIRTKGQKTLRKDYMGVCKIIYYDTSLQFELQSIGETIIKSGAGGDRTLGPLHAMQVLVPAELQPLNFPYYFRV